MQRVLFLLLTLILPTVSVRAETMFTDTNGPRCKDYSKPEFGNWICPGPGGYAIAFMDDGNVAGLAIARADAVRNAPTTAQFLGAVRIFGDKVQWILREGVPKAAVIRIWRRKGVDDQTQLQELTVYAVDGNRACAYGTVDVRRPKANELALTKAEEAAALGCPKEQLPSTSEA